MLSWLFAKFYDSIMADAEEKCLRDWRRSLLQDVSGDVLELGCGTGANLASYSESVRRLILAEPDRHMRGKLAHKLSEYRNLQTSFLDYDGKHIPLPNDSVDAVVCTLVLCTAKDPQYVLSEVYRVLKPGAKLLFIEHIAAVNNSARRKWQKCLEPFWKIISCGCHLTRDTEKNIVQAGFKMEEIHHQSMRGVPAVVRPSIRGIAVKCIVF